MNQNDKEITIDQSDFLNSLFEKFSKFEVRKSNTPASSTLLSNPLSTETKSDFPYSSLVGSLIWLTKTRPDISYAVSQCSRYLHNTLKDMIKLLFEY